MATGVKPRDDECQLTRSDLDAIQDAMKHKKFRDMLADYCEEVRDPANIAIYQKEMVQMEKERGYDVTFINPKGGYVIKTSVAGDRKAFINICSSEIVAKPSYTLKEVNGQRGMNWQLPYSIIPPREDYDHKRKNIVIYDVVFHPDTLRMAHVNKQFKELVNNTAIDGLQNTYNIQFDSNNLRFIKAPYKGITAPAVIRKADPNYKPPCEEDLQELSPDIIEKLYPQHTYTEQNSIAAPNEIPEKNRKTPNKSEFKLISDNGYTVPKYIVKQQKNIELQDFTYHRNSKQYSAIPSHLVVEVSLPLLSSTKECNLDVNEKSMILVTEKPAKYKLNVQFPYRVNEKSGNAIFDKSKQLLIITLPVVKKNISVDYHNSKIDSGVESEDNCQSDEDNQKDKLIEEISSENVDSLLPSLISNTAAENQQNIFFEHHIGYLLPRYTHNVLDDTVAFTFHIKNTEPESVKVEKAGCKVFIKFSSMGAGFVPVHFGAILKFDETVQFSNVTGEAWDNNVILQLEVDGNIPQSFMIGLDENSMICEYLDVSQVKRNEAFKEDSNSNTYLDEIQEDPSPNVEVMNLGTETNIVVSTNPPDAYEDDAFLSSHYENKDSQLLSDGSGSENAAKSILRKPTNMIRSFSESNYCDIASSVGYVSSDCVPEESSYKKTVRFSDVIAKQFYRYNSSIEGQKRKNQRKKSKKRNQERRKSESEAEDEVMHSVKVPKHKIKSALKKRHDSGIADTSDVEVDNKSNISSTFSPVDCLNYGSNENSILNIVKNEESEEAKEKKEGLDHKPNLDEKCEGDENTSKSMLNIVNGSDPVTSALSKYVTKELNAKKEENSSKCHSLTHTNLKHNTDLYDPDQLNKGQYLEVAFKNDLIFDLDM